MHGLPALENRASQLESKERVAAGGLFDPDESRAGERMVELCLQSLVERGDAERAESNSAHRVLRDHATPAGRGRAAPDANCNEESDRIAVDSARGELQHPPRRRIEPLQVVGGDKDRRGAREKPEHGQKGDRDGTLVRSRARGIGAKESNVKGRALR